MKSTIPNIRVRATNNADVRSSGGYVLYWMTANRRAGWNFSLQRAVEWAADLRKPLIVFEALRCGYRWASDRLHRFVLQGMPENAKRFEHTPAHYFCYVEPEQQHGEGLLETLADEACVVVTDDFPCFFLPAMLKLVSRRLDVKLEAVDSNGLLPMRATDRVFTTAHSFRRFLQKELPPHLEQLPAADPFAFHDIPRRSNLPAGIRDRWPAAGETLLRGDPDDLAGLPIDHSVGPACFDGGSGAAEATLNDFLSHKLARYGDGRNHPDDDASSGLSPYLHFGHISVHEVFSRIGEREGWSTQDLSSKASGSREGWWNMSPESESFLDELVTWRELGFNMCAHRRDYDRYESLPDWAKETLEEHAGDEREHVYSLEQFEAADTHDRVWNAAQTQLATEGRLHNYLRMLWGKKILEWSATPRDALATMIHLNNKYAVDGRDPNSYSGIFWVLGRYDRAWGPERPVFGKVRYMSSENTLRKLRMKVYLQRFAPEAQE